MTPKEKAVELVKRSYNNSHKFVSLDAPVGRTDGLTLLDTLPG